MTGTMTWAAMDVHARSIHAATLDVTTGELSRRRFDSGRVEPVIDWLLTSPAPVHACYEAGPTGFGLYRLAARAGVRCEVTPPAHHRSGDAPTLRARLTPPPSISVGAKRAGPPQQSSGTEADRDHRGGADE